MKSKTSFFNKGLIFSNLKRYSWASILWSILLFLSVPLSMLNKPTPIGTSNQYNYFMYSFGGLLSNLMLCTFPVLIGVLVFRYLHSQKSSTVLHGLPFSRPRLFASAILSGIILIIVPILLNWIITTVIMFTTPIGHYFPYDIIMTWLINSLCMGLVVFALTVFVGMFTGNLIAHAVFTYIIHFLPFVMWITISELLTTLVLGFSYQAPPEFLVAFPMMRISSNSSDYNIYYIAAAIILFALAFITYRKRPAESAGDIVSFRFVRPIFKYGVTFCTAIVGFIVFNTIYIQSGGVVVFIVFALIGYCLAQMLIAKSWRVWKCWKGFVGSVLVILIFWAGIEYDITGFEKRIPETDNIASVSFTLPVWTSEPMAETSNTEAISIIRSIHEKIINNPVYQNDHRNRLFINSGNGITITYQMKNGSQMSRSYHYDIDDFVGEYNSIYNIHEIKAQLFPYVYGNKDIGEIESADISLNTQSKYFLVSDKNDIKVLMDAYKADIEATGGDFFAKYRSNASVGYMHAFVPTEETTYLPVTNEPGVSSKAYHSYNHNIQDTFTNTIDIINELYDKYNSSEE